MNPKLISLAKCFWLMFWMVPFFSTRCMAAETFTGTLQAGHVYVATWPVTGLHVPFHHASRIEWSNLRSFKTKDGSSVVFRVDSKKTDFVEGQRRWNDSFLCTILQVDTGRSPSDGH